MEGDKIKSLMGENLEKALDALTAIMVAKYGVETIQLLNIPRVVAALLMEHETEIIELMESDTNIVVVHMYYYVVEAADGEFKRFRGPMVRDEAVAAARKYAELAPNPAFRYYVAKWPYRDAFSAPELIKASELVMH